MLFVNILDIFSIKTSLCIVKSVGWLIHSKRDSHCISDIFYNRRLLTSLESRLFAVFKWLESDCGILVLLHESINVSYLCFPFIYAYIAHVSPSKLQNKKLA